MAYLDENGLEHFWGKIKDHVSSAVAPKADDADVVHKTGDETVDGVKLFAGGPTDRSTGIFVKSKDIVKGTPTGTTKYDYLGLLDSSGSDVNEAGRLGTLTYFSPASENSSYGMHVRVNEYVPAGEPQTVSMLEVGFDGEGNKYATAPETSDDRTNSTDIVTRGYMEASEWNWQKTKKAGAVAFKPVPESDLEPVVDFMFTETPPAEGEKGPENPSIISGVTQAKVTRCGKNLIPFPYESQSGTISGVEFTVNNNGTVLANGTASANILFTFYSSFRIKGGTTYCLSGCPTTTDSTYCINIDFYTEYYGGGYYKTIYNTGSGVTFTEPNDCYCTIYMNIQPGISVSNLVFKPQLELGTTTTAFEPYEGSDYTIQLGNTYYGGSLDVATGVMTVTHEGVVIPRTNIENAQIDSTTSSGVFSAVVYDLRIGGKQANVFSYNESAGYNSSNYFCNYYPWERSGVVANTFHVSKIFAFLSIPGSSAENARQNLLSVYDTAVASGNPIAFVYPLDTPYTVQLTPTQIRSLPALDKYEPRINTVYTDQEAVQVGYQRFANYVDLTTDQTVEGSKTFISPPIFSAMALSTYTTESIPALAAYNPDGTGALRIDGGRNAKAAFFVLYGGLHSSGNAGGFILGTRKSDLTGGSVLVGKPNGTLEWGGQPIQTTSDERLKTTLSEVPDAVLDAWEDVNWGQFQYLDAVASKGESARLHLGLIAQHVMSVFEQHGLNACDYGILCHEEHEATGDSEAVDLWMVRYAEAQAMEACCMRRENARLKKRIADLEERLAALELKVS